MEGVARDLSARWASPFQLQEVATTNSPTLSSSVASGSIETAELCGALTVGVLRGVRVTESPRWLRDRLVNAGMRAINNVVDASNYVMLETGQPTHPYDAALVVGRHLGVRQARSDEQLVTLDATSRPLGRPGRGLGDTGVDCVIVDGNDAVIGLAGIMGGATSEISDQTTNVLVEAAFFDPMTIARSSKRLGLRTEASSRFERGVDPTLAPRALARFVKLLQLSSPELEWLADPVTAKGFVPVRPVIELEQHHVDDLIGTHIDLAVARPLLSAIGFSVESSEKGVVVTPPAGRLDVRPGAAGRADVIEEIARLYSYARLARHTPTWVESGGLNRRQQFRRRVREAVIGLGFSEAWTPSLISDADYELADPSSLRVRITNPLASDESVLRSSLLVGLTRVWARNLERGFGDEAFFEIGTVVTHPGQVSTPRTAQGGEAGAEKVELPTENEILLLLLGREGDDAQSAVATWKVVAERLDLSNVVVRSGAAPRGWHPTRHGELVVRATGEHVGRVGELDADFVRLLGGTAHEARRVGLVEIDLGLLGDEVRVPRRDTTVVVPSRFPVAAIDLAFVTPDAVNADDLRFELAEADELVEEVVLFDVYRDANLGVGVRSLAFAVRLGASDRTLSDAEIAASRERLIAAAATVHAQLR